MADFDTPADRRDDLAADRDDAAERRDLASSERDTAADLRDARADGRAEEAEQDADDLDERLAQVRRQILDRLARIEDITVDGVDRSHLTAAGLGWLRAHAAEARCLADLDRAAISGYLDDLRIEVQRGRVNRSAAVGDRLAAAQDRVAARRDRQDSAQDRHESARDRAQAAIERQQADFAEQDGDGMTSAFHLGADESLIGGVARAVAESRQRIAEGRAFLNGTGHDADPATTTTNDDARPADPEHT